MRVPGVELGRRPRRPPASRRTSRAGPSNRRSYSRVSVPSAPMRIEPGGPGAGRPRGGPRPGGPRGRGAGRPGSRSGRSPGGSPVAVTASISPSERPDHVDRAGEGVPDEVAARSGSGRATRTAGPGTRPSSSPLERPAQGLDARDGAGRGGRGRAPRRSPRGSGRPGNRPRSRGRAGGGRSPAGPPAATRRSASARNSGAAADDRGSTPATARASSRSRLGGRRLRSGKPGIGRARARCSAAAGDRLGPGPLLGPVSQDQEIHRSCPHPPVTLGARPPRPAIIAGRRRADTGPPRRRD